MGFAYLLRKYASQAAADCPSLIGKQVSPHALRHSCAMVIYQATGDLRKVALWRGHASRALARAGLNPPSRGAHLLRHSLATGMLRKGASLAEIGQLLGHRLPH